MNSLEIIGHKKKCVLFSHGFGTKKDSFGLFTDIGDALKSEYTLVYFNYDSYDQDDNTYVATYSQRIETLRNVIEKLKSEDQYTEINIVGHSLGCLITALLNPTEVNRVILLAPPIPSIKVYEERFRKNPESIFNKSGKSIIVKQSGRKIFFEPEFWIEMQSVKAVNEYSKLAENSNTCSIIASEDEILKDTFEVFNSIPKMDLLKIHANHNFEGEARLELINLIKSTLDKDNKLYF